MDDENAILPQGEVGEVVIRGPNVTLGYDSNPSANAKAFTDGWFRTGDQGRLDEEGYLFLTGRLKEQINRGGEKISPLEVDVVLLDHPAIAQACTFGIPHDKLGEEVGVVVVLRPEMAATEAEIRDFASRSPGRLQGAAPRAGDGRHPERRHRQGPAHRARRQTRPGAAEAG